MKNIEYTGATERGVHAAIRASVPNYAQFVRQVRTEPTNSARKNQVSAMPSAGFRASSAPVDGTARVGNGLLWG
jgi:hypothetical protein